MGDYLRSFPPLKNGVSGRYNALNRDKRSFCLDLKSPAGREVFLKLLPHYDVVVESFRPGVLDRLGLSYQTLAEISPKVILCSISGYGQTGPLRTRAGHDLDYVALAGLLSLGGPAGQPPQVPGAQTADIAGGTLWAVIGILSALLAARQTSRGRHLDISMCEGALSLMIPDLGNYDATGELPKRGDELLTGGKACYSIYETSDGKHLAVAALEPKFWLAFNRAIGRTTASEHEILLSNQSPLRTEIQAILKTRTRDQWTALLASADCCVEPVLSVDELATHPQHMARELFFSIGDLVQVRTPLGSAKGHTPPPEQGQHTDVVLREIGLSDQEIAVLRQTGAAR